MKLFIDVTISRRSMQSVGVQRMTRQGVAPSTPESSVQSVLLTIAGFLS